MEKGAAGEIKIRQRLREQEMQKHHMQAVLVQKKVERK